jgi:hypothetical protein
MPNRNPFRYMSGPIGGWFGRKAERLVYETIPTERVDHPEEQAPLQPYASYFRLWLSEMYLSRRSSWGRTWLPAVHSEVRLAFGDHQAVTISRVAQPPQDRLAEGVRLNYQLTDLLPYNGGAVEVEASLLALEESDQLKAALGVLALFSSLVTPPIGQALAVAEKVSLGARDLITAGQGRVHLGFHETFTSEGGGGQAIRPGYLAVLRATGNEVDRSRLHVREHQLHYRSGDGRVRPFDAADYLLLRVEGRSERDDWRLRDIQEPLDQAILALAERDSARAAAYQTVALAAAWKSLDLTQVDRRRVVQAIKDEVAAFATDPHGATGRAARDLGALVAARGMPRARAVAEGDLTAAEVFA